MYLPTKIFEQWSNLVFHFHHQVWGCLFPWLSQSGYGGPSESEELLSGWWLQVLADRSLQMWKQLQSSSHRASTKSLLHQLVKRAAGLSEQLQLLLQLSLSQQLLPRHHHLMQRQLSNVGGAGRPPFSPKKLWLLWPNPKQAQMPKSD